MSVKEKKLIDTYKSRIENYDYLNMYPPIQVSGHDIQKSNLKDEYKLYIEDYDYSSHYIPQAIKEPTFRDLPDTSYATVVEDYPYADESDEPDPDELLRTAEDYIDYLNKFIEQLNNQVLYLLGENQNYRQLLDKFKGNDSDKTMLIEDLQKQYKKNSDLVKENEQLIIKNKELTGQVDNLIKSLQTQSEESTSNIPSSTSTRNGDFTTKKFRPDAFDLPFKYNDQQASYATPSDRKELAGRKRRH